MVSIRNVRLAKGSKSRRTDGFLEIPFFVPSLSLLNIYIYSTRRMMSVQTTSLPGQTLENSCVRSA